MYNDDRRINRTLLKIMIDKGVGVNDMAAASDKSKQAVSNTLHASINPTVATLDALANAVGCDLVIQFRDRATGKTFECE